MYHAESVASICKVDTKALISLGIDNLALQIFLKLCRFPQNTHAVTKVLDVHDVNASGKRMNGRVRPSSVEEKTIG